MMALRSRQANDDRHGLLAARAILKRRENLSKRGDLAYGVYLGIFLTLTVAIPVLRVIVLELAENLPNPGDLSFWMTGAALLAVVFGALTLAAAQLGPAHASLPELYLLHASGISRRRMLARPIARAFLLAAVCGLLTLMCSMSNKIAGRTIGWGGVKHRKP